MKKSTLFQYAILWHPTEKQYKEEGMRSKLLKEVTVVLADSHNSVQMQAAMDIPTEYRDQLDQIEIASRPF